jgi:hypothetical protein
VVSLYRRLADRCANLPVAWLRRMHLAAMCGWLLMVVPAILWWRSSIAFVVAVSLYANFAAHFSAWQGARSEEASG